MHEKYVSFNQIKIKMSSLAVILMTHHSHTSKILCEEFNMVYQGYDIYFHLSIYVYLFIIIYYYYYYLLLLCIFIYVYISIYKCIYMYI